MSAAARAARRRRGGAPAGDNVVVLVGDADVASSVLSSAAAGEMEKTSGFASIAAAVMVFVSVSVAVVPGAAFAESEFYMEDIPQGLSSGERDVAGKAPSLATLVKGPNGREIEKCATKCIATCTRGGSGAPGLGPLSIRKAPVVFKEGFRSRQYCLSECTEICSITVNSSTP